MKGFRKALSALLITAAVTASVVIPSGAAGSNYDPGVAAGSCNEFTFYKYLNLDDGEPVPTLDFTFTLEGLSGQSLEGYNVYEGITAGVKFDGSEISGTNVIKASFSSADAKSPASADTEGLISDGVFIKKPVTLDFSDVQFTEPGLYAYTITEGDSTVTSAIDGKTRYLYILVDDNSSSSGKTLKIKGFTFSKAVLTTGTSEKSVGFVNKYPAYSLSIGKMVDGNQGSKDKYFKFTVTLTSPVNTTVNCDLTNADGTVGTNSATESDYIGKNNPSTIDLVANTPSETTFYLQHGQYIAISGLPEGANYVVSETAEDYTSKDSETESFVIDSKTFDDPVSGTVSATNSNVLTGFTNTKEGVIPTGILMKVAPVVIVGVVVASGIVFLAVRSAKRKLQMSEEDDT